MSARFSSNNMICNAISSCEAQLDALDGETVEGRTALAACAKTLKLLRLSLVVAGEMQDKKNG